MTKEKKSFATECPFSWPWDTVMTLSLTSDKMTVQGTNTEVKWCPVTEMFWEVQTMKNYKLSYKYWLGYIVGTIERFVK